MRAQTFLFLPLLLTASLCAACASTQTENEQLRQQTIELQNEQQEMALRLAAFEEQVAALNHQVETLTPPATPPAKAGSRSTRQGKTAAPVSAPVPAPASTTTPPAATSPVAVTATATAPSGAPAVPPPTVIPFTPDKKAAGPVSGGTVSITSADSVAAATSAHTANAEQAAYQKALADYEKRRYNESIQAFDAFISAYPQSRLLPNALYWKGECLYSQGKYADAVFAFKQVITDHSKHAKTADALLKAALTYKRLGDNENKDLHVRILREDFPDAPAARKIGQVGL